MNASVSKESLDARDRPARLTVGVVGAGRVGPALAASLQLAGHRPVAVSGVSDASVRRAAALLPDVPLVTPAEVLARAELALLTVPDDALPGLVEGLAETGAVRPGQLLVHTSGRYGTKVLDPALRAGALPLALHPAMTFTGSSVDVQRLAGCSFGVTAPEELRLAAEALVIEMGGEPEWIAEESRPLYHAALALGANHLVTLVAQSMDLLRTAGVGAPDRMLGPLLGAALDNALRSGDAALTGPVARGDAGTVSAHIRELRAHAPQTVAGYLAAASPNGSPRSPGRSTTRPSPSGRTTWSPSSRSPWTCSARPGWARPTGCSAPSSGPRSTTPCAPVTRRSPAPSPGATPGRCPPTSASCAPTRRRRSPDTSPWRAPRPTGPSTTACSSRNSRRTSSASCPTATP
nr:DUF2520 domain-containing protein [Streptomyces sp. gb1(2016)]